MWGVKARDQDGLGCGQGLCRHSGPDDCHDSAESRKHDVTFVSVHTLASVPRTGLPPRTRRDPSAPCSNEGAGSSITAINLPLWKERTGTLERWRATNWLSGERPRGMSALQITHHLVSVGVKALLCLHPSV